MSQPFEKRKPEPLSRIIAKYASSRIYGQLINTATTFCRPNLLTPELFGLWYILKIIPGYVINVHMGTMVSLRFLIPYLRARKEEDRIARMKNTVLSFSLTLTVLAALTMAWASAYPRAAARALILLKVRMPTPQAFEYGFTYEQRVGMLCVAGLILFQFAYEYIVTLFRAYERFNVLGANNYLRATVTFALTVPLMYVWGIYGLFISALLVQLIVVGHLRYKSGPVGELKFDPGAFRELLARGLPMHLSDVAMIVLITIGPIAIARWMSTEQVGYYAIALTLINFLQHLPGTTREITEPRMMRGLAHTSEAEVSREYLLKPLVNMVYIYPLALGGALLTIPVVVPLAFPKYAAAVAPTLVLIYGFYFLSMCEQPNAMLLALNRPIRLLFSFSVPIVLNVALCHIFIHRDMGISGVALANSLSYFTLFAMYILLLQFSMKEKCKGWYYHIVALLVPFILMWDMMYVLGHLVPMFIANRYLACLLQVAIYLPTWYGFRVLAPRFVPLLTPISWKDCLSLLRARKSNG
ncbi:oligosaccharide flippase family protein [Candidatus Sumerlaeota bacterium]|nr:oligosaccharide flippase family protein [Candidatus Sumerlaeota bacterium]